MFESEEPSSFVKHWAIPFLANVSLAGFSVCVFVFLKILNDHSLAFGTPPESFKIEINALVDIKVVALSLGVALFLALIFCFLATVRTKKPKGRLNRRYLRDQFLDELRSFSLSTGSISFMVSFFTTNSSLLTIAIGAWALWAILNWLKLSSISANSVK